MMLATPLDLSGLGNQIGNTTATTSNTASSAQDTQDRFLKLLVAQLNNQDPMNPMDNAQMTTQMTQINTVAGIENLNATMKGMASQFSTLQTVQSVSLVGREALVPGQTFGFDGTVGKAAFRLDGPADQVQVDVLGKDGAVMDTIDFGALTGGQHAFNWDGSDFNPNQVASYRVRASNGGSPVGSLMFSRLTVTSVGMQDGAMQLQLQDGRSLGYDKVSTFL